MSDRPKLLILTSRTGGGHMSLANALRDELQHDYSIKIIDPHLSISQRRVEPTMNF